MVRCSMGSVAETVGAKVNNVFLPTKLTTEINSVWFGEELIAA